MAKRISRRQTWITLTEMSAMAGISKEKLEAWLSSKQCPFGYGTKDEYGHFLSFVLRKDFEQWLKDSGISE